ncbi:hypothetical protein ABK040_014095 [Willaertia magna]
MKEVFSLPTSDLIFARDHLKKFGNTDIFLATEVFDAIFQYWDENTLVKDNVMPNEASSVQNWLELVNLIEWVTWKREGRSFLIPGPNFSFRKVTKMNPIDTILFTALMHKIGKDLEANRGEYILDKPHKVFSYQFDGSDGRFFVPNHAFKDFQDFTKDVDEKEYPYVVCMEIPDFLESLSLAKLEEAIHHRGLQPEAKILKQFFQSFESCENGIPIETVANRILLDLIMTGVDVYMSFTDANIIYTRFNDSFRAFCKTSEDAHSTFQSLFKQIQLVTGCTSQKTTIAKLSVLKQKLFSQENDGSLSSKLGSLLRPLINYEKCEYEKTTLTPVVSQIKSIGVNLVLLEQLKLEVIDEPLVRFCLNWLGKFQDKSVLNSILESCKDSKCFSVFKDVILYFKLVKTPTIEENTAINDCLLGVLKSVNGNNGFLKLLILNYLFEKGIKISDQLTQGLLSSITAKEVYAPEVILLLSNSKKELYQLKEYKEEMNYWERLAFIRSIKDSCYVRYFSSSVAEKLYSMKLQSH